MTHTAFQNLTSFLAHKGRLAWDQTEQSEESIKASRLALCTLYSLSYELYYKVFQDGPFSFRGTKFTEDLVVEYRETLWGLILLNPKKD